MSLKLKSIFYRKVKAGGEDMVRINGTEVSAEGIALEEYLRECEYDPKIVAVEINGSIIKRTDFKEIVFSAGDSVEIVCFVGGG